MLSNLIAFLGLSLHNTHSFFFLLFLKTFFISSLSLYLYYLFVCFLQNGEYAGNQHAVLYGLIKKKKTFLFTFNVF